MRILLINPSYEAWVAPKGRIHHRAWPPLDLLNCAAILRRAGHDTKLIDDRVCPIARSKLAEMAYDADRVLLTTTPLDRWQCPPLSVAPLLPLIRSLPLDKLVLTGAHATVASDQLREQTRARWIHPGEPERWAQALGVGHHEDGAVDIRSLPLPAYDTVDLRRYHHELFGSHMAMLETSRGCAGGCEFCLQAVYDGPVRHKTASQVLEEVDWVVRCGARRIMFIDLDFLSSPSLAQEILSRLARVDRPIPWCCDARADALTEATVERMRRAGCRLVHVGVEFGSQARLTATGKGLHHRSVQRAVGLLRDAGIESACLFMAGYPGETDEDLQATLRCAIDLAPDYVAFAPAVNYRGGISGGDGFELYQPERSAEIHRFCATAVRRFYLRPGFVLRHLRRLRDGRLLARQLRLFVGHVRHGLGKG